MIEERRRGRDRRRGGRPAEAPAGPRRHVPRVQPGAAPGLLAPVGPPGPVGLRLMRYTPEGLTEAATPTLEECLGHLDEPGVTWIDVEGLSDPEVLARLGRRLGLHPLALEDVLTAPQRPKVEAYPGHHFLVLRMVRAAPDLQEEQLSLFFGASWVLTVQERPGDVFDPVRERLRGGRGRLREAGADYLAYALLDAVVDGYFPALETVGDRLERLEDEALAGARPEALSRLLALRHDLTSLRRALWPLREVVAALQREPSPLVAAETRVFLRDCYDHAVEALELVETFRETVAALMEMHLALQNQRLNEVMKVLTVMATVFIPLTFIASIYGMNFQHMPELGWPWGYPAVLALMALVAGGLLAFFRRRGWW